MANMFELGIMLSLLDSASGPLRQFSRGLQQTATGGGNAIQRLSGAMEHLSLRMEIAGGTALALGQELRHLAEKPIEAFAEMDSALNNLAVATLDKTGQVGAGFEQIRQKVLQIDSRLPMTTAQVAEVGTALKSAGVTMHQMLSGAYDAAANLSVVLKMPGDEAGLMVARLREAYGLAGNQLPKMADLIQRARFAFGISPEELRYASSYSAPTLNMLGLTGLDNAQKLLAIQGMGAGWNFQGSSFGTNFSMFLARLSKGPQMIEMAKRSTKGLVRHDMERAGVKFNFYDAHGQLKSVEAMISQLENARNRLKKVGGDKMVMDVLGGVFGQEAGRVAEMLAEKGIAGYKLALKRMADQASLDQRIALTMKSAQNTWTVFSTNVTNALAALAQPAVEWLLPMINQLSNAVALSREWLGEHKTFAKWTMLIVGGLGLGLTTLGSILLTAGLFMKVLSGPVSLLGRMAGWIPRIITGIRMMGLAFLEIPYIGWITAIVIGLALAIWHYWTPIKAFFAGFWNGLSSGFAPVMATLQPAFSRIAGWLRPVINGVHELWTSFKSLLPPVNNTGTAAYEMGEKIGRAIAGALEWVAKLVNKLTELPSKFVAMGRSAVDGLTVGIQNRYANAKSTVSGWAHDVKGWFANPLGIHSPSRVFIGFGENIGEGTEIGILNRLGAVRNATGRLSSAAINNALAVTRRSIPSPDGSSSAARSGSSHGLTVHFSPTIHVQGAPDVADQVRKGVSAAQADFERRMREFFAARHRVGFAG